MRPNFSTACADQRAHLFLDGDIGLAENAGSAELFGQGLAFRRAAAGDDDFGAFGDENLRGPQPYAACRTGNNRYLAIEPSHCVLPVLAMLASLYLRPALAAQAMLTASKAHFPLYLGLIWIR